jgi:hypothetical protein
MCDRVKEALGSNAALLRKNLHLTKSIIALLMTVSTVNWEK